MLLTWMKFTPLEFVPRSCEIYDDQIIYSVSVIFEQFFAHLVLPLLQSNMAAVSQFFIYPKATLQPYFITILLRFSSSFTCIWAIHLAYLDQLQQNFILDKNPH